MTPEMESGYQKGYHVEVAWSEEMRAGRSRIWAEKKTEKGGTEKKEQWDLVAGGWLVACMNIESHLDEDVGTTRHFDQCVLILFVRFPGGGDSSKRVEGLFWLVRGVVDCCFWPCRVDLGIGIGEGVLSKTDGLCALVIGAESWWREGEESSVGGLHGGLWWFSDGDETKSQAGLTMMARQWAMAKTPTKSLWPVWKEGAHIHVLHPAHSEPILRSRASASGGTCRPNASHVALTLQPAVC
jgi:hypothetical protein